MQKSKYLKESRVDAARKKMGLKYWKSEHETAFYAKIDAFIEQAIDEEVKR